MTSYAQSKKEIVVCILGRTRFAEAWELQRQLFQSRVRGKIPDVLLLTEHEKVYTIGKTGRDNHILASHDFLQENKIEVFNIDRGGDVTYHGPGQLVAYPILDLQNFYLDVHRYLRDLEEVIILTLQRYGISAERDPQYTGVWVRGKKIAAIGVKVSRWITMHGVAVNVAPDLRCFDWIVPCGISGRGVTSVETILLEQSPSSSKHVSLEEFGEHFVLCFGRVFGLDTHFIDLKELESSIGSLVTEEETCPQ